MLVAGVKPAASARADKMAAVSGISL